MKYGEIENRILDYMFKGGQDSIEGIAYWWMLGQDIKAETAEVKAALDRLVNDGLVVVLHGKDSRNHYRINRGRRREIESLLNKTDEAS